MTEEIAILEERFVDLIARHRTLVRALCWRKSKHSVDRCAELVQACYLDADGTPLFESVPMNWLAPDGTLPAYWEQLFEELGMEVPQGVPGTNPQQLSESPLLTFIRLDL